VTFNDKKRAHCPKQSWNLLVNREKEAPPLKPREEKPHTRIRIPEKKEKPQKESAR